MNTNEAKFRAQCPICALLEQPHTVFSMGLAAWEQHVGRHVSHPEWHTDITDPDARNGLFRAEFSAFYDLLVTTCGNANRTLQ